MFPSSSNFHNSDRNASREILFISISINIKGFQSLFRNTVYAQYIILMLYILVFTASYKFITNCTWNHMYKFVKKL